MTDDLILIHPTMEYTEEIYSYQQELFNMNSQFHGDSMLDLYEDIGKWIENCRLMKNTETISNPSWVEAEQFMLVRKGDKRILGMINFRHYLNNYLEKYGGHIGYGVRPTAQRKGYAKKMLALCLEKCRERQLLDVLITCDADNEASRKTILSCGGVFECTVTEGTKTLEKYWIRLSDKNIGTKKSHTL